jgi:3-phosphoshikimate 1-carboxyvinyltransferase
MATYGDHRMAMTFAPLALKMGAITIEEPDVVKKSYPQFWEHLSSLGFELS